MDAVWLPSISAITLISSHFSLQLRISQSFSTVQSKAERPIYLYNYGFFILFFSTINNHSNHLYLAEQRNTSHLTLQLPLFYPIFSAIRPQNTRIFPLLFCHLPFLSTISSHFSLQLMPANPVFSAFCIFLHYSSRFSLQLDRIVSTTSPLFLTEIFPIFSTSSPYCFYN